MLYHDASCRVLGYRAGQYCVWVSAQDAARFDRGGLQQASIPLVDQQINQSGSSFCKTSGWLGFGADGVMSHFVVLFARAEIAANTVHLELSRGAVGHLMALDTSQPTPSTVELVTIEP